MTVLTRFWAAAKAAARSVTLRWQTTTAWSWSSGSWAAYGRPTTPTPRANSICEAVVATVARTFPESPVHVLGPAAGGKTAPVRDHPLARLVAVPNPYYGGEQLWRATIGDWYYDGNAYWYKKRNADGRPVELWWLPAWTVEPVSETPSVFVEYYRYAVAGAEQRIPPDDVVHFRNGLDPANPRRGRSPFASVLAEVFQDQEAASFGQALLANMGVPGVVIAPKTPLPPGPAGAAAAEAIKTTFRERFGGERRGDALVLGDPTEVSVLSFSPAQMDLTQLRRVPEERITAVVGVSAMVVGLGVGYEHSIYNNYDVAYQALYETNLIPTQRLFAGELQVQLLPDLGDERRQRVAFDNGNVRVLQPDLDALWRRVGQGVGDAIITPNEAREAVGLKPLPGADVLYVKVGVTPTPSEELVPPEPEPEPALEGGAAPLRALPPPKGRRGAKAARPAVYAAGIARIRTRTAPPLERAVAGALEQQRASVLRALNAPRKALGDGDVIDSLGDAAALLRAVQRAYRGVLEQVVPLAEGTLGVPAQPDEATIADYLAEAGRRVVGMTETTRRALVEALRESVALGESAQQTAERVEALTAFDRPRATTIARTEVGHASQLASLASFRASGLVSGVLVLDGDGCGLHGHDGEPKADGMRIPLERMGDVPTLAHPNCVRAFAPLVDAAELVGAA